MEDKLHDFVQLRGNHAHTALDIVAENEVIHNDAAKISTQHTEHHDLTVIAQRRGQGHHNAGDRHSPPHIHPQVFIHNLGYNVQAARGGIVGEQNGQADTHHQNIADHVQQRILGNGLEIRKNILKNTHDHRHKNGGVHGFYTELRANQQKANDQQAHIHNQRNG